MALEETGEVFSFSDLEADFSWHKTGKMNIAYEAVDRHVDFGGKANEKALIFDNGRGGDVFTFGQMKDYSNQFANVLRKYGIGKGDRVVLYMPRCPETYISCLGILKVGAILVPIFNEYMEDAVRDRLLCSGASAIVTAPENKQRFNRHKFPALKRIFVVNGCESLEKGDIQWHNEVSEASREFTPVWVDREDPMMINYAPDAHGRSKGMIHVHNDMLGYLSTGRQVHDLRPGDVYWCTSDLGGMAGVVYGFLTPWILGTTIVVKGMQFDPESWYDTLARFGVTVWYSTPTVFRMMMVNCEEYLRKYDTGKLRHIMSFGEPLTRDVLEWSLKYFKQPIYETWWMIETGMNMICNMKGEPVRPGSIGKPVAGVEAAIIDDEGREVPPNHIGNLAIRRGWPAQLRGIWNNHEDYYRFFRFADWFVTGDSAYKDKDGYFYFQGRVDGLIKTSGERVGPFEVESKLMEHPAVADAGVTGKPDPLRGEIVKAYIKLNREYDWTDDLFQEIHEFIRTRLAVHAAPREIEVRNDIPRTKEGKVDRRVLKEWVLGLE